MPGRIDSGVQAVAAAVSIGAGAVATSLDLSVYWIGVPMPIVLASFAGSCCALSFLGTIGRFRAMTVVACSTLIAAYLQPLLGVLTGLPALVSLGLAFATGLFAHIIGTAIFAAAPGALKEAFSAIVDRIRGRT